MPQLVAQIRENTEAEDADPDAQVLPQLQKPVELLTEEDKKMTEVEIDGNLYIGYLSIPVLELELPVLTDWSYAKLKVAPCHYFGSYYEKDFVNAILLAEKLGVAREDMVVVSVMPCVAKKYENSRPEMEANGLRDVDAVLTVREFATMIKTAGIDFAKLEDEDLDSKFLQDFY